MNLVKTLIVYKRWLYTIYQTNKGKDDLRKTIQADIAKYIDDNDYKQALIEAVKSIKHKRFTNEHVQSLMSMMAQNTMNIGKGL